MDLGLRFGEKFRTRERKEKKKNTTVERERDGGEDCKARRNPQRFSGLFNFDHKSLLCSRSWKFRNGFETRRGCNFLRATCFHP